MSQTYCSSWLHFTLCSLRTQNTALHLALQLTMNLHLLPMYDTTGKTHTSLRPISTLFPDFAAVPSPQLHLTWAVSKSCRNIAMCPDRRFWSSMFCIDCKDHTIPTFPMCRYTRMAETRWTCITTAINGTIHNLLFVEDMLLSPTAGEIILWTAGSCRLLGCEPCNLVYRYLHSSGKCCHSFLLFWR
jgi:hypothetical protein